IATSRIPPSRWPWARRCLRTSSNLRSALSARTSQLASRRQNAFRRARWKSAWAVLLVSIEVDLARAECVKDDRVVVPRPGDGPRVVDVRVPMEVITRPECPQEPEKSSESPMGVVGEVVDPAGRRVCQQDVEIPAAPELVGQERRDHPRDDEPRVALAELVWPVAVAGGPSETRDEQAVDGDDPTVEVDALPPLADRGIVEQLRWHVMVPVHRVERYRELRRHEVQIVVGQVAAAQDQVHGPEARTRGRRLHRFVDHIAQGEDPHLSSPPPPDSIPACWST